MKNLIGKVKGMKEKKGITLIALVITIVILIILAGVLVSITLGNNGLFGKAKTAKEMYINAQEYEDTEIAKYSNEIDSYVGGGRNPLPIQIIYPDNPNTEAVGSEQNPDIISIGNRIEINNPYPGHNLNVIVQVKTDNGLWGETGWIYSAGGWGVRASQLQGQNIDKIVIQAGGVSVLGAYSQDTGSSFGTDASNISTITTHSNYAPFRLKIQCVD